MKTAALAKSLNQKDDLQADREPRDIRGAVAVRQRSTAARGPAPFPTCMDRVMKLPSEMNLPYQRRPL